MPPSETPLGAWNIGQEIAASKRNEADSEMNKFSFHA
jgi:hypothetical protein